MRESEAARFVAKSLLRNFMTSSTAPDWHGLQQITAQLFRQLGCDASVDQAVEGVRATHDIDVWVSFKSHGLPVRWAVECKHWKARVNKAHVLTLRTLVEDVGADKGILVSQSGFQPGAVASARKTNIALVSPDELRSYLSVHLAGLEKARAGQKKSSGVSAALRADVDALPSDASAHAYSGYLLGSADQALQRVVIRRLEALGGKPAVMLLARRLTNTWGMSAIQGVAKALGRMERDFGLVVLAAFLLADPRFYYARLEILEAAMRRSGDVESQAVIAQILRDRVPEGMYFAQQLAVRLPDHLERLRTVTHPDIAMGIELSAWYCSPAWANVVRSSDRLEAALTYVRHRLPDLLDVLQDIDLTGTRVPI